MSLELTWQSPVLCLVSKPDSVVMEVEVDRNAIGQDILDKVCASIGTVEKDYFGLQYYGPRREPLWLNLRNRIAGKISGQAPFRLRLRVKYFVEPHHLLQGSTRRIFYLQIKQDFLDGRLKPDCELLPIVLALAAQIEHGDIHTDSPSARLFESYAALFPSDEKRQALSNVDLNRILAEHQQLKGTSKSAAIAKFLAAMATISTFGTECYKVKLDTEDNTANSAVLNRHQLTNVTLHIGPLGIDVRREDTNDIKRIPFKAVHLATHTGKLIDIHIYQDDASIKTLAFRTSSEANSNALYRIITEMLAFYTWDTVHSTVMRQHSLDFKGHFLALFRPNDSDMVKQYVFDVQRTSREVYDNARRILYHRQKQIETVPQNHQSAAKNDSAATETNHESEVLRLKERLSMIADALSCRVCFDTEIECVFVPCGHQVCCKECAKRCENCPVCRQTIDEALPVFLPITKDLISGVPPTESTPADINSELTNNNPTVTNVQSLQPMTIEA